MTMPSDLCLTARFLQPYSHARGEDGSPEWPPSPLRMFQALVATAVGRQRDAARRERAIEALRWLERQPSPEIFAPSARQASTSYLLFVPDNIGDQVARRWSMGTDVSLASIKTEKVIRPMHLQGEAIHYVYRQPEGLETHLSSLRTAARSITHLGWGIDMVVGDAGTAVNVPEGERWIPGRQGGPALRRPVPGTLDALERKHAQFLRRLEGGVFHPVTPLSSFTIEPYARAAGPIPRPLAAFRLLEPITGDRLSLDPRRRTRDVAAWTRHAVAEVCQGWPYGPAEELVHGHGDPLTPRRSSARFSFLPLPTINPRLDRVEGIARVVIAAPHGLEDQLEWVRVRLAGHDLSWQGETVAFLEPLPASDWVLRRYAAASDHWSTITPVVLPGHDERSPRKAESLLRKAFLHAGFEPETVASITELEWRKVGFRAGLDHASRYRAPDKIAGPQFHLRVRFEKPVAGPLAIGSGRFRGLGVFAVHAPPR